MSCAPPKSGGALSGLGPRHSEDRALALEHAGDRNSRIWVTMQVQADAERSLVQTLGLCDVRPLAVPGAFAAAV